MEYKQNSPSPFKRAKYINTRTTRAILALITASMLLFTYFNITSTRTQAGSFGFNYKYMLGVGTPIDPDDVLASSKLSVKPKQPEVNNAKLYESDITTIADDSIPKADYTVENGYLSEETKRVLPMVQKLRGTGDTFENLLNNWENNSEFFDYSIAACNEGDYVLITVNDLSKGLIISDLFDMQDEDIFELNTNQEHGFSLDLVIKDTQVLTAITPTVNKPGQLELLIGNSLVVVVRANPLKSFTPISVSSDSFASSVTSILEQNKKDPTGDLLNAPAPTSDDLNLFLDNLPPDATESLPDNDAVEVFNELPTPTADQPPSTPPVDQNQAFLEENIVDPRAVLADGYGYQQDHDHDHDHDHEVQSAETYLSERGLDLNDWEKPGGTDNGFYQDSSQLDSYSQVAQNVEQASRMVDTYTESVSDDMFDSYEVLFNGKLIKIKEVPKGYRVEANEEGQLELKKNELNISGINFGVNWGVAERPDASQSKQLANVDTSGNSLLKNVRTRFKVNVDTLTSSNIRSFHPKPLPVRWHPIQQSDRIVIIHGSNNWAIAIGMAILSVVLTLIYFSYISANVSRHLKVLKKNAIIRNSQMEQEIESVDVSNMHL